MGGPHCRSAFSILPTFEAAAVSTSAQGASRRMVSTIASAVNGLIHAAAPSSVGVPWGRTMQSSAFTVRYSLNMPPAAADTRWPSRACAAGLPLAATASPTPRCRLPAVGRYARPMPPAGPDPQRPARRGLHPCPAVAPQADNPPAGCGNRQCGCFSISSATSTIMSSCPPTILRRPSSTRIARVSIPYSALAFSAWRRKLE